MSPGIAKNPQRKVAKPCKICKTPTKNSHGYCCDECWQTEKETWKPPTQTT